MAVSKKKTKRKAVKVVGKKKPAPKKSKGKKSPARRPETLPEKQKRGTRILSLLEGEFPQAKTELEYGNALQLLVATILSAQCTDQRVNLVCRTLFQRYRTAADFATVDQPVLEQEIRSTGFYRNKAKNIIACCKALVAQHGGEVPKTMEELVVLPGVGRKTANVVLGQAYGISVGVVVDTHVFRLSNRMELSDATTAEKVEEDLMQVFPAKDWISVGSVFILHGRKTCDARKPECGACVVNGLCPSAFVPPAAPR